jgi:hypothetical protein
LLERVQQEFGTVEGEQAARARLGIAVVRETCLGAGAFVFEYKAGPPGRDARLQCAEIFARLFLEAGEGDAFRLGCQHAAGLAVHIKHVVCGAGRDRELANGNAEAGTEIDLVAVLHRPAGRRKQFVDLLPGAGFGGHRGRGFHTLVRSVVPTTACASMQAVSSPPPLSARTRANRSLAAPAVDRRLAVIYPDLALASDDGYPAPPANGNRLLRRDPVMALQLRREAV